MAKPELTTPPQRHNAEGNERAVGVEIEFGDLSLDATTDVLLKFLERHCDNCEVSAQGRYEKTIQGDAAGDWVIEFDYSYLKKMGREQEQDDFRAAAEKSLAWVAESVVPVEVVSPPLPLSRLAEVENLMDDLRAAGARGSSDSLAYAFGMQLNPELPRLDSDTIMAHIKAFLCLYDWLLARINPDISRRISNYIDPFPNEYLQLALNSDYWPDLETLMDDYLKHNPTRNRALDMLPLFRHLDADKLVAAVDSKLVKARPTFHYRLPGCEIHDPNWGLHSVWNDWIKVEQLAANKELLDNCGQAFLKNHSKLFSSFGKQWLQQLEQDYLPQLDERTKKK
ncbi:amidoligase family protein [Aliidiomarina haloalkalitolerans]|uniref:Alpha-L-fucosidase n=1 Tax=Aliidiomarina haloalkalitolerans TaxID=859059 RepID=A0A432VTM7_9GAMM|nr:amidoligase family protein [Aliidiomarina haloalkalitolerans]RUO19835.1 alpha-L-fucosidase [Aliidiomarina haloalkalitolerans]